MLGFYTPWHWVCANTVSGMHSLESLRNSLKPGSKWVMTPRTVSEPPAQTLNGGEELVKNDGFVLKLKSWARNQKIRCLGAIFLYLEISPNISFIF